MEVREERWQQVRLMVLVSVDFWLIYLSSFILKLDLCLACFGFRWLSLALCFC